MAIAFVQSTNSTTSSTAYLSNNTAGNLLILVARLVGNGSIDSGPFVTDSQTNTWRSAGVIKNGNSLAVIFYASNCKAGANTVTVTGAPGVAAFAVVIAEYSGVNTPGTPVTLVRTTTSTPSVGPTTPAAANNLVIAMFENETANGRSFSSPTGGFTIRDSANGNAVLLDLVQSSASAATAGVTISGAAVAAAGLIVSFTSAINPVPIFIQAALSGTLSGTTTALAFSSNTQAGSLLVCVIRSNSGTAPTLTDSQGNTWFSTTKTTNSSIDGQLFYALATVGGANTVTASWGASRGGVIMALTEYGGISGIRNNLVVGTGASTAPNSGNLTPTAGDLVIGYLVSAAGQVPIPAYNTGLTARVGGGFTAGASSFSNSLDALSTGSAIAAAYTITSDSWICGVLSFIPMSSGVTNLLMMMGCGT